MRLLSLEDLLIHLALHSSYHHRFDRSAFQGLVDIHTVIVRHGEKIDWQTLAHRAVEWKAAGFLYSTLRLTREVLGAPIPDGTLQSLPHVYAAPGTPSQSDGNEATDPNTAQAWAEHSFWPQDPQIPLAIAGGVTVIQVLPGSANLFGGRSVTLRLIPARTVQEMKYPGAPYGLKMACGENPKRNYEEKGPSTRMGNIAGQRTAFAEAEDYVRKWKAWREGNGDEEPKRDLRLETLAGVLAGEILVQNHCYRADEMANMLDLGREFGFRRRKDS